ncbi:ABC transporter permease [Parasphaerochaeta coccoides]|uniref:Monosaccharide ABC transporter membrane protein, CUT2 family n=1 Tax=Parasphaerochaeta coccoides (strain ATCC BAA-1237 / DSM 17374 / SPN1) TaxID=760011 RepID=F4GI99_PARC1|nr:ABC transporter permease [Parasphaerochaeta coccoides]AEC01258.1 monosaccharide ABC transporter membrane protein, CUT2 family [Parasphaerochaeta coccoides DSM 17374]
MLNGNGIRKKLYSFQELNLLVIVIVLMVFLSFVTKNFLTLMNLENLVRQTAINGIISLGMTFIIMSGGIDLSVGSILGIASIVVSKFLVGGMPTFPAFIVTLAVAAFLGAVNGLVIHYGKIPPFVATLGMSQAARGIVMLLSNARMVAGLPKKFTEFAQNHFLGIPNLFFVWLVIILITYIITSRTTFGRNVFAVGSNREAARLSGISIPKVTIMVYLIGGLLAGIAGILMTSRLGNGIPTAGQGYETDAIASAVVGGASLSGGAGTILGTVLGAMLISVIQNGGNLLGINPFILQIVIGVLIVASVWIDQSRKS